MLLTAAAATTVAAIAAAVRAQCFRLAIVVVTQFHYQKRALVLLFHFITFRSVLLDEVVFVENNFLCIFFCFLFICPYLNLALALFVFVFLYNMDSHDRSITQNELSGIYATVRPPVHPSARILENLN